MVQYSIEELHALLISGQIHFKEYYEELFKEIEYQQIC